MHPDKLLHRLHELGHNQHRDSRDDRPNWHSRDRRGPEQHYGYRDESERQYPDQRRHEPYYRPRYYEDRDPGDYRNQGGRPDGDGNVGGFRIP